MHQNLLFTRFLSLILRSIGTHQSYHNSNAFKVLYDAFIEKLLQLARIEIFIVEIMEDAVSNESIRLCKYVGMTEIKTMNNSAIYKVSLLPPSLRITSSAGKNLFSFFKSKYENFKELFQ